MAEVTQTVVTVNAEEKVGLPNYSNVTIGTSVSRTFSGEVDEVAVQKELAELVEGFVAGERQAILESLK
jgi:hypothetical protein